MEKDINELIAYLEDKEFFPDGEILDYKDRELIIDALVFYKEMNT